MSKRERLKRESTHLTISWDSEGNRTAHLSASLMGTDPDFGDRHLEPVRVSPESLPRALEQALDAYEVTLDKKIKDAYMENE